MLHCSATILEDTVPSPLEVVLMQASEKSEQGLKVTLTSKMATLDLVIIGVQIVGILGYYATTSNRRKR